MRSLQGPLSLDRLSTPRVVKRLGSDKRYDSDLLSSRTSIHTPSHADMRSDGGGALAIVDETIRPGVVPAVHGDMHVDTSFTAPTVHSSPSNLLRALPRLRLC
jgi:hypothetical protein